MLQQLARAQEKLKTIDSLSNYLQKIDNTTTKNNIAYLIHRIIEADYLNSDLARAVMSYGLLANRDMFVTVK